MGNVEDNFVMIETDADNNPITFNTIEDESGDIFWGYGHQDADTFIDEINRWLVHTGAITDPDDFLFPQHHKVEHRYAKMTTDERFELTESDDDGAFLVTRLML